MNLYCRNNNSFLQNLDLSFDLKEIPEVPGLEMAVLIHNSKNNSPPKSNPIPSTILNDYINWKLKLGTSNTLTLHRWQWSQLGIGTLLIVSIMILSMILQNLKLKMGFGFPELPP